MHTTNVLAIHDDGYDDRARADRFLQRHVWARLNETDRRFLQYAAFLPEVDHDMLAGIGFADAAARWQRLRREIPYLTTGGDAGRAMRETVREFVRRTVTNAPSAEYGTLLVTIGRVLEGWAAPALRAESEPPERLTPAELAVLRALAEGRSNRDIARAQGRSENTVRVHVSSVLRKLGARSRNEAAAIARRCAYVA
jgi:DNA-binding CsgD family transcriptional regulator